jgi:hypothetical protein
MVGGSIDVNHEAVAHEASIDDVVPEWKNCRQTVLCRGGDDASPMKIAAGRG